MEIEHGTLLLHTDGCFYGTSRFGSASVGTVYKVTATGEASVLVQFDGTNGNAPYGALVSDQNGSLWGTTKEGGAHDHGTIFKVKLSTSALTTVVHFNNDPGPPNGIYPLAGLVHDGNGFFWGTTSQGGASGRGTVFKVNIITGALTTVVDFTGADGAAKGANPQCGLVSDGSGFLWGTTYRGGEGDFGTVFKVNIATGAMTNVAEFTGSTGAAKGSKPSADLVSDGSGFLWGTTELVGGSGSGTVFKVNAGTGELTSVIEFTGTSGPSKGSTPQGKLVRDFSGFFWGTTSGGGGSGYGTVFKLDPMTGSLATIVEFTGTAGMIKGSRPRAGLVNDGNGSFWGTTENNITHNDATVYKVDMNTGTFTTVVDFIGSVGPGRGEAPDGGLVNAGVNTLWGTTISGGAENRGTVFKMDTVTGALTTLVDFTGTTGAAVGAQPFAKLLNDGTGSLWGTTSAGGAGNSGTVFRVNADTGAMTTVIEFTGTDGAAKGSQPSAGLLNDGAGFFWGTTTAGGTDDFGTIFNVEAGTGTLTTVVEFSGTSGTALGGEPHGALTSDGNGFFWGTTSTGGAANLGTIFKLEASTGTLTTMIEFTGTSGAALGSSPQGALLRDGSGLFLGTTSAGGADDLGTVFKINAATGELTTLVEFTGGSGAARGSQPFGGLANDGNGSLWGMTSSGGASNSGTIFRIDSTGAFTNVFDFTDDLAPIPGYSPGFGALFLHSDGNLYGTTTAGGITSTGQLAGNGQIFRILLNPPALTEWKFVNLGSTKASDLDDLDADGIANLIEYGLALLPNVPDGSGLPEAASFQYPEGERLRAFVTRDPAHNDVTLQVQFGSSVTGPWTTVATSALGAPFTGPGYVGGDSATPGVKTVEVRDVVNVADEPARFVRVRVTH